jgi:hypothetical protein
MKDREPVRLFEAEDAPAPLQGWLRQAQQDRPTPEEAARLVESVEAQSAVGEGAGRPAARRPWLTRAGRVPGRLVVAVVLAGVGTVGYFVVQRRMPEAPPLISPPTVAPIAIPASEPAPAAPAPVIQDQAANPSKIPEGGRPRSKVREIVHRQAPHPEPAPSGGVAADEFALLRDARRAIVTQPERALNLAEQHAQRFPAGMLTQEREAIAIEALAKLGRDAQAQSRARIFLKAHPGSPYKPRIDAALARLASVPR